MTLGQLSTAVRGLLTRRDGSDNAIGPQVGDESHPAGQLGLRQCSEPIDSSHAIDIVFVHGLTGDREKTWTHHSTGQFWPEAFLPLDLPVARVFTYGYDADVAHWFSRASRSDIRTHAQNLLAELAQRREPDRTQNRPLVFVAHSLGGLIVEDTLLASKNSFDDHHKRVLESVRGIMFMGTPHCGSQVAEWAQVLVSMAALVKKLNESIIGVLQTKSEVLARIQQEFHTTIRVRQSEGSQPIRMTCFFEDLATRGVGTVVPKHSATLPGYSSHSIPSDHAGMTKFRDADDVGYKRVSGELWIWAREIAEQQERERAEDATGRMEESTEQLPRDPESPLPARDQPQQPLDSNQVGGASMHYYMGSMQNVGQVFQGGTFGTFNSGKQ